MKLQPGTFARLPLLKLDLNRIKQRQALLTIERNRWFANSIPLFAGVP